MPGLDPGIHAFTAPSQAWMAGTSPAMTNGVYCAVEAHMAKRAFDKIMAGVKEGRAYLNGTADKSRYRVHAARKRKPRPVSDKEEKRIQRGNAADPDNPG
jgi:hypothetical protein